jgi:hypothetical protein
MVRWHSSAPILAVDLGDLKYMTMGSVVARLRVTLAIVNPLFVFAPPSDASALVQLTVANETITCFGPLQTDILQAEMTTNRLRGAYLQAFKEYAA